MTKYVKRSERGDGVGTSIDTYKYMGHVARFHERRGCRVCEMTAVRQTHRYTENPDELNDWAYWRWTVRYWQPEGLNDDRYSPIN